MNENSRESHVAWCKSRALPYIDAGDLKGALMSMVADLGKHQDTQGHIGITMGLMDMRGGKLNSADEMREFINGFL